MKIISTSMNFNKLEIYHRDRLLCVITKENNEYKANVVEVNVMHPFKNGIVNGDDVYSFLIERVFDFGRGDRDELLSLLGLKEYNAYEIAKKTHGILFQDFIWLKFDDDEIEWAEVKQLLNE